MTFFLNLSAFGSSVTVEFDDRFDQLRSEIEKSWSRCLTSSEISSSSSLTTKSSSEDLQSILSGMVSEVTIELIDNSDPEWFLVHASCAADVVTGECIAFVGPSGMGKTTLSTVLGKKYAYVTDETLAVNLATGEVAPYAKPLLIREDPSRMKKPVGPSEFGLLEYSGQLKLKSVYYLQRINGEAIVQTRPLPVIEALQKVVPQISHLSKRQTPIQDLFNFLNWGAGIQEVIYSEANDLIELVRGDFESDPQDVSIEFEIPTQPELVPFSFMLAPSYLGSLRPVDCVVTDDKLVYFSEGNVEMLNELATLIWLEARQPQAQGTFLRNLANEFAEVGVDRDAITEEIKSVAEELASRNLLQFG